MKTLLALALTGALATPALACPDHGDAPPAPPSTAETDKTKDADKDKTKKDSDKAPKTADKDKAAPKQPTT